MTLWLLMLAIPYEGVQEGEVFVFSNYADAEDAKVRIEIQNPNIKWDEPNQPGYIIREVILNDFSYPTFGI